MKYLMLIGAAAFLAGWLVGEVSAASDNDGDGYTLTKEEYIFSATPGSLIDAERCGPNNWPSDLVSTGLSADKVTVEDISSFMAPIRRLDSSPGDPEFTPRWDLSPGQGGLTDWINIIDLTALYSGTYPSTGYPPMFGGLKALGGPACTSGPQVTLVGAGDIAGCGSSGDTATKLLLDSIPGTVFTLGDNAYQEGDAADFNDCYDPTWGQHKARTRAVAGNHDWVTDNAQGYRDYFGTGSLTTVNPTYYAYEPMPGWRVYALDSDCGSAPDGVGGCVDGSPQYEWLQADLAANPRDCVIGMWHHARWTSGDVHNNNTTVAPLWDLLYDNRADLVLSGHSHNYERFKPQNKTGGLDTVNGITQIVVGTGGIGTHGFDPLEPNSEVQGSPFGVLKLTLKLGQMHYEFVPVAGQTFTDSGDITCTPFLQSALQDVKLATAYRYGTKDNLLNSMDTAKIITDPSGGYLSVYHTGTTSKVATSTDLLNWTYRADLLTFATQPTIIATSDGGFVVGYEKSSGGVTQCAGGVSGNECLYFRYYPNRTALLTGAFTREKKVDRLFSNCAEGTPNIYSVKLTPDIDNSVIDVGFHYFRDCDVDRQARGTLTNFTSWTATVETATNNQFEAWTPPLLGNVGDRDPFLWNGAQRWVHEAQYVKGDFGTWRIFLRGTGISELSIKTHNGSTSFGNPTMTQITSPSGKPALLVTYFIFSQGVGAGEAGELVFYREY